MTKLLLRRLILLPLLVLLANFFAYAYAFFARGVQAARNPFIAISQDPAPLIPSYLEYLATAVQAGFGQMPNAPGVTIWQGIQEAAKASLGLVIIAFCISVLVGSVIGLWATRNEPPGVRAWLAPLTTVGLALPSFYIGALLIALSILSLVRGAFNHELLLPIHGFGWDKHLVFPVIALAIHPTLLLAQVGAVLLSGELVRPYVVAGRSFGHDWSSIRTRFALRNVLSPVSLNLAKIFRWLLGELILVEVLFGWPGMGRLLGLVLMPPHTASAGGGQLANPLYLNPALLATLVALFALLFQLSDILASAFSYSFDPRQRAHPEDTSRV